MTVAAPQVQFLDQAAERPATRSAVKRIVYIDHTATLGGGEIALLHLVTHLDRSRFEPVVILFSDGPLRDRLQEAGVEVHVLPLSGSIVNTRKDSLSGRTLLRFSDVIRAVGFTLRLARLIKQLDVDLVHTNSLKADIIGGLAGRRAGLPVIWHIRDRIANDYLPRPIVRLFRLLARTIPTFVVANSVATLKTVRLRAGHGGMAIYSGIDLPSRARVIYDGTNHPLSFTHRNKSGINIPVIGLIGRITPWKGQHIFIRAAQMVLQRFPLAHFQIIGAPLFGEDEYDQQIHKLADSLVINEHIEFLGFRNDVAAVIASMDILVHASTTGEPFGQVIVEGMAAGKPVVATDGGGVPEIVVNGVTGLLVPMSDPQAMAEAICQLLANPKAARQMGKEGRHRVESHFTIEHTVGRIQTIYDDLLQDRAVSGSLSPRLTALNQTVGSQENSATVCQ